MNEKNLTPFSVEERERSVKAGSTGGIISAQRRRERKTLRMLALEELEQMATEQGCGDITKGMLIVRKAIEKATADKDVQAMRFVAELSGDLKNEVQVSTDAETAAAIRGEWASRYAKQD